MAPSKRTNFSFIEMVKCNPVLYDMSHLDYKNIFLKNKVWDEIGEKYNISGDEAKVKWKNLRDTYGKYLKSIKETPDQFVSKTYSRYRKWQWASSMDFLKGHLVFAPTDTTGAKEEESVFDSPNVTATQTRINNLTQRSSTITSPKRYSLRVGSRKKASVNEHPGNKMIRYLNTKLSAAEHVMLGYAKTIDGFTQRRKIITKMKIAQVMMKAELEEEEERSLQRETISMGFHQGAYFTTPDTSQDDCSTSTNNLSLDCNQDNAPIPPSTTEEDIKIECKQEKDFNQQED